MSLYSELRRRNVFRVAIAYVIVAWLLMQIGDTLAPALRLPEWTTSLLAFFLILGFPVAIFFAWAFELTPEGIRPEKSVPREQSVASVTGRKLNFLIIGLLAIAVGYFAYDKFIAGSPDAGETAVAVDATPDRKSIAVLPFVNMSADPEQEYFSDGLAEELLNLLAKIPQLRVTSRSSAFSFKGKDVTIDEIGRQLGVTHVLEGSVRRSGGQIRVTAQLIDVASDAHLWSETWDREFSDVFSIQDDIAAAVTTALKIQLVDELPHAYVTDPEAYNLYLRAIELTGGYSRERMEHAATLLEQVIRIDPGYGPALVRMSDLLADMGGWNFRPLEEAFDSARQYADRAIAANPDYGEGYLGRASIALRFDRDYLLAQRFVDKALELDPHDLRSQAFAGLLDLLQGRKGQYVGPLREQIVVDPLSIPAYRGLGHALMYTRQYDEAAEIFARAQEINPNSIVAHTSLGQALLLGGHIDEAHAEFEQEPFDGFRLYGLTMTEFARGNQSKSDQHLQDFLALEDAHTYAAQLAEVYAFRGEVDEAFQWLEYGFEHYDQGLVIAPANPKLDNLRDDPRFEAFVRKLGSGNNQTP